MDASLLQRIDLLTLTINLGGDKKAIRELLQLFLHTNAESLKRLELAEQETNVITWLQLAHQIKGAANYIGAKRLAGLCSEAEHITHLPDAQSRAVLYHLHKEMAHLREAIGRHVDTL